MLIYKIIALFLVSTFAIQATQLIDEAKRFLGGKYVWGGTNPYMGADSSGLTQFVYQKDNINLPRTAFVRS